MHTGRGDAAKRAKTRTRIPVAVDASDGSCGFCVGDDFERFSQIDDVFSRSRYDPEVHNDKADAFYATYRRPLADWRAAKGYQQNDYAFRNATWHVDSHARAVSLATASRYTDAAAPISSDDADGWDGACCRAS